MILFKSSACLHFPSCLRIVFLWLVCLSQKPKSTHCIWLFSLKYLLSYSSPNTSLLPFFFLFLLLCLLKKQISCLKIWTYLFIYTRIHFLFLFIFIISWKLITLQYCSGFCHTLTWISHGFTCVPHPNPPSRLPPHPILLGLPSAPALSNLSHASSLGWWSVSPLIVYLFQCCSLWTSHPRLLPQSPKVCSIYLCFFFCFAYRVIITIFLNSIYMR